ncbi:MAG: aminodeoxychorismate lyase [Gammaproteobacteria bacterium]|nr:aminodeoxychorismate lyase [Gammaproteobacteria bacterium]MCP4927939.1 aminodeoxychorismate lyase [Gammaproteobacteria bacterium]
MDRWLINGVRSSALAADDRGLAYGDGLFETLAVRAGKCRFIEFHLDRLTESCVRLGIPFEADNSLRKEIAAFIAGEVHGTLKLIVTRGKGPRGYAPPDPAWPTRLLGFSATTPATFPHMGVRVRYCQSLISRNRMLAGMKTLNRLEQVMARAEWAHVPAEYQEGLMLNDRDEVVCGTMTNLFMVRADGLYTPALDESGVAGIMRSQIINIASDMQIELKETSVSKMDIRTAEGVFLTNSLIGLWPVQEVEGQSYGIPPLIVQVRSALAKLGVQECQ